MEVFLSIAETLGYPAMVTFALAYFVKYTYDKNMLANERMTEALNNNTLALTKLQVVFIHESEDVEDG